MESVTKSTDKAWFRLTMVLPWALSAVLYFSTVSALGDSPRYVSAPLFALMLNTASIAVVLYLLIIADFWISKFIEKRLVPKVVARVILCVAPFVIAAFVGFADAPSADSKDPGLMAAAAIGSLALPLLVAYISFWILLVTGGVLFSILGWFFDVFRPLSVVDAKNASVSGSKVAAASSSETAKQEADKDIYTFDWKKPTVGLDGLAGMAAFKTELASHLHNFRPYASGKGSISDRNGFLLSGPPGNGKTVFAEAIAGELGLPYVKIGGQDLTSKWTNESTAMVKELFRQAGEQPCVVFFDEFDSVAMNRGNANMHGEDRKVVNALLSEIDSARRSRIVLIAATNYADQIDAAIARDGRFDFRIEIPFPDQIARTAILTGLLTKFNVGASVATIEYVSQLWERRSVAFIEATVKRLRDNGKGIKGGVATVEDFKVASREASRRASAIPSAGAKLSEISLTADVRRETDSLVYRLRNWEQIAERGGEPPSGVLLYGPPGTGKTNLVRALARELEYWHVFEVNASDVLQNPRKFRDTVELAANHRPAIIFLDEADELLRERVHSNSASATNEILKCMDGMMGKIPEIVFMAATNNAELMDAAALRGGRFSEKIYMGRLTGRDLVDFLEKDFSSKTKVQFAANLTPELLASRLREAAPSDAIGILRKAINYTFGQSGEVRSVCMEDIDKAILSMQL